MISKSLIIGKLSPFMGKKNVVTYNQDAGDIITGILHTHEKYKSEYDKIYQYFVGSDLDETSYNVWQFLKQNVPYYIEPEETQFLKSPSGIISTKSDCKSYALFANGIMDAYRRNEGLDFDLVYRFASYDPFDKTPQHVFSVVKENGNEFWIDPVLSEYDLKKDPSSYKDKKIQNMALVALSGIGADTVVTPATGGSSWFDALLKAAPSIISAFPQQQTSPYYGSSIYSGQYQATPTYATTSSTGISTNTLLLIGGVGLAAYLLLKRK